MKKLLYLFFVLQVVLTAACQEKPEYQSTGIAGAGTTYTCPMHPQIVENKPGSCPICSMNLVPATIQPAGNTAGAIMLTETQIKLGNITTQPVQNGRMNNNTLLTGRLVTDETQLDLISSRASGRIEKLYVKETGLPIRKGQPLYDLYSETLLTLEREYLLALEQYKTFPQEKEFAGILAAAKEKLLLFGLSKAQLNAVARTRRPDARLTFLAPASGIITEIAVSEGMYVPAGGLLYRVSRLNKIWVEAEVYASEVSQLQTGAPVAVKVPGIAEPFSAKVSFINPEFRQSSQVVVIRAELPNPKGRLVPGMPATVTLSATSRQAIVLPTDAVIRDERGAHVWVKTGKNTFAARQVTLGEESARQVAIQSGLNLNDTVVVTGSYLLHSEFVLKKSSDQMAEHTH